MLIFRSSGAVVSSLLIIRIMIFLLQVVSAEARGASGVIFYTDPEDYAVLGPDAVYPNTVMMPPSGTQLGTVKLVEGDPLTPYYPAIGGRCYNLQPISD